MAFHGASSSSSSSSIQEWDVFLSFRGEDTRTTFTAHLYDALHRKGINTFMDKEIRRGEEISPAIFKAIEDSKISIIVLSKNYASSSYCLDELMKILECRRTRRQKVLSLFYHVDPSEVRHQTNSFGEAFAELEEKFKDDVMKVQRWKTALKEVADLSGMPLGNKNEPEFIHEIIGWVNSILARKTYFQVAKYPVGIELHVENVKSLLDIEKRDRTYMLGIFGIGGIGKTTIAKAVYNSIASHFEGSCFLDNIRETFGQKGMIHLQEKLLDKILENSSPMVDNVDQGITLIGHRLHLKSVLIVLDDVDHLDQLDNIVGEGDLFGLGSRIIITTRDKDLLSKHQVLTYKVKELDDSKALRLFSCHAFGRDKPDDGYVEVTKDAVCYAGGLPLALVVLGSTVKGKDILYWKSKLGEYKKIPHIDIQKRLRISFDGLDENAKNIFLHIACFFNGKNVEYVKKMLLYCGFHSDSGIEELKDKCLITQSFWGLLVMHDLLQEMGREIVRLESPNEPGKRSRLWFHEDVRHVLKEHTGTNKVEGILIDFPAPDLIHLSPKAFKKMKRLRMFINRNARFYGVPNFLPNELRLLDWPEYPGESLPSNFCGENLVELNMRYSYLKELEGLQNFQNMTTMNFSYCRFLKKIPDVSRIPNLETLYLNGCTNLVEVHCSVGFLDKLVDLSLDCCYNLRIFPRSLKLRSLERLVIGGCSRLKNFPEIECQMERIEYVKFVVTGIEELEGLQNFQNVTTMNFSYCQFLKRIPDVSRILNLETLYLDGCKNLVEVHCSIGFLDKLVDLSLDSCYNLRIFPRSFKLRSLERLVVGGCSRLKNFPEIECQMERVEHVKFVFTGIKELPSSIGYLVGVKALNLGGCTNLTNLPNSIHQLQNLEYLSLNGCTGIKELPSSIGHLARLKRLSLDNCANLMNIPSGIYQLQHLEVLTMINCKQLREILGLPSNVQFVMAEGCASLAIFLEQVRR